ncbi:MAG: CBS domain-containing protein, partial [Acetivibrio sp.]
MNILFFLKPKVEVAYLYDDYTIRQALETMEHHRYSSIPLLNRNGKYVGTITEGDLLW